MSTQLRFRDLMIGQTFDFVDPALGRFNSYYRRVVKTSTRSYTEVDNAHNTYRVGSIDAPVFHVGAGPAWPAPSV